MLEQLGNPWWVFVLVGLTAGIVGGALGVGGGIIFIPALVIFFAVEQKSAQGTALAVMVPMALVGAFLYWRNSEITINPAMVALLACGAVVGVVIGSQLLAAHLPAHVLRKAFAVFMVVVAVKMLMMPTKRPSSNPQAQPTTEIIDESGANNEQ